MQIKRATLQNDWARTVARRCQESCSAGPKCLCETTGGRFGTAILLQENWQVRWRTRFETGSGSLIATKLASSSHTTQKQDVTSSSDTHSASLTYAGSDVSSGTDSATGPSNRATTSRIRCTSSDCCRLVKTSTASQKTHLTSVYTIGLSLRRIAIL